MQVKGSTCLLTHSDSSPRRNRTLWNSKPDSSHRSSRLGVPPTSDKSGCLRSEEVAVPFYWKVFTLAPFVPRAVIIGQIRHPGAMQAKEQLRGGHAAVAVRRDRLVGVKAGLLRQLADVLG